MHIHPTCHVFSVSIVPERCCLVHDLLAGEGGGFQGRILTTRGNHHAGFHEYLTVHVTRAYTKVDVALDNLSGEFDRKGPNSALACPDRGVKSQIEVKSDKPDLVCPQRSREQISQETSGAPPDQMR